jgi:endonuclease YncB( thermonuclease family)
LRSVTVALLTVILCALGSSSALAIPATKVFLNGVPTPVFFNDGDSFRVLAGKHKGTRARMVGFNTLETYGPVHQWGEWTFKELYVNSKMGTLNARNGIWRCSTEKFERDTYGRILWDCPGLAVDQVWRGYAHAMTVTDEASSPALLAAQHDAQEHKRGMWSHGIPHYILTSLHSFDEARARAGKNYNRVVSTGNGHSAKWLHDDVYKECDEVCRFAAQISDEVVHAGIEQLLAIPEASTALGGFDRGRLFRLVADFARLSYFPKIKDNSNAQAKPVRKLRLQSARATNPRLRDQRRGL